MHKASILIVEDEAIVAEDLAVKLNRLGYKISAITARGEDAINLAREGRPDLVLMDIRLAGFMDGIEAADQIRRECNLPVIYLTAHSDSATLQRAKITEPFGYILKPFEKRELETYIEVALYKHQAEQKLREDEQRYRLFFERNPDGVFSLDSAGRMFVANPACEVITGYTPGELTQMTFMQLCAPDHLADAMEHLQRALREFSYAQLETFLIRKDGRPIEVWVAGEAILMSGKGVVLHCTAKDITERKRSEEQRIILSKLESTGILAGGLAHDFNNLLTATLLHLDLVQAGVKSGRDVMFFVERIRESALAAQDLTKQLISFAKGGMPVRRPACLAELIHASVRMSLSGSNVRGEISIEEDLYWANVDRGQIGQVLRNLGLNARDAMPEGGVVCVQAQNVTLPFEGGPALPAGNYVCVAVVDQGQGIPAEVLPKIFDPYFSTKPRGADKGMGLGLTICHTIVKNHGGTITVKSQPGIGATFQFYLPACEKPRPVRLQSRITVLPVQFRGSERILVMDDEACMRVAVASALEGRGFQVATAQDGQEAVKLYETARNQGCPFDLVILDLTIRGGMGGRETMQALLKMNPEVKAIVMTGYSEDPVLLRPECYGFIAGIEKSFDVDQLIEVIARVLETDLAVSTRRL